MKISVRLLTIAHMIIKGKSVADIGADHALLCTYLAENGLAAKAIATEIADGPYQRTRLAVTNSNYQDKIEVRQGDGLSILEPGEVTNVVIAGMGGDNIIDILTADWAQAITYKRYVFQPMTKIKVLREFLALRGWPILDEQVIKENGRYFVVIAASPDNTPYKLNVLEAEIGPLILTADTDSKRNLIKNYRNKYTKIRDNLLRSGKYENIYTAGEYQKMIDQLEVLLVESQSKGYY